MSVHTALKTETPSNSAHLFSLVYVVLSVLLLSVCHIIVTLLKAHKSTDITSTGSKKERVEDSKTGKDQTFVIYFALMSEKRFL